MNNKLEVFEGNQVIGEMTWEKSGMTYILNTSFSLLYTPSGLFYLYLVCGEKYFRLGIPAPCENKWCLKKRISESELRQEGLNLSDCSRVVLLTNEPQTKETFAPLPDNQLDEQMTQEIEQPVEQPVEQSVEQKTESIPNGWFLAQNIDSILNDNVLLPLLRGKEELIAKNTADGMMLAMPYDILDEIYFTPAFCLMQIMKIDGKTYFVLTLDKNGWPIPPETSTEEK